MDELLSFFSDLWKKIDYIQLGGFILILIIGFIARKIAVKSASLFFKMIDKKSKVSLFSNYLKPCLKPIGNFVSLLSLYIAIKLVSIPNDPITYKDYLIRFLSIFLILNIAWFLTSLVSILIHYLERFTAKTESKLDDQLVPILKKFLRIFIFVITGLIIIQNLGFSVSGILAGFGLGGFALAFASKDTLANIFGSIVIFADRPFQIGDWIKTSESEGIIEEVGLRSTKIRTFEKTLVTIPNSKVADSVIENISARPKRRISYTLGVKYSTSASRLREAVDAIKNILSLHPRVDQETILVHFTDFGPSSLNIFIYFFTDTAVWAEYLEIKEDINLKIMENLETLGVEIAFPSTSVYLEPMPGKR